MHILASLHAELQATQLLNPARNLNAEMETALAHPETWYGIILRPDYLLQKTPFDYVFGIESVTRAWMLSLMGKPVSISTNGRDPYLHVGPKAPIDLPLLKDEEARNAEIFAHHVRQALQANRVSTSVPCDTYPSNNSIEHHTKGCAFYTSMGLFMAHTGIEVRLGIDHIRLSWENYSRMDGPCPILHDVETFTAQLYGAT